MMDLAEKPVQTNQGLWELLSPWCDLSPPSPAAFATAAALEVHLSSLAGLPAPVWAPCLQKEGTLGLQWLCQGGWESSRSCVVFLSSAWALKELLVWSCLCLAPAWGTGGTQRCRESSVCLQDQAGALLTTLWETRVTFGKIVQV